MNIKIHYILALVFGLFFGCILAVSVPVSSWNYWALSALFIAGTFNIALINNEETK